MPDIKKEDLQRLSLADLYALQQICSSYREIADDDGENAKNEEDEEWAGELWYYYDAILWDVNGEIDNRLTALAGPVFHKAEQQQHSSFDPDANPLITPSRETEDKVDAIYEGVEDHNCPFCGREYDCIRVATGQRFCSLCSSEKGYY